ncbi:MAG: hypothetical protein DRQ42_01580 [Gammaproteobacteria bacterium]|nr:MAG: hypothetical protein DRQ42_01580 [Gammaproteobacteria bacterium]
MDAKEIRKRYAAHKSDRTTVEANWDIIERYIVPLAGGKFFEDNRQEQTVDWNRARYIYDSTAIMAHRTLTAHVHSTLTSAASRWFDLRFKQATLNDDQEARAWLEECGELVYQTLQESNFDLEINKAYSDMVGFGNTAIVEEVPNEVQWEGVNFSTVPIRQIFYDPGLNNEALNFYRRLEWEPSRIIAKWGIENVPEKVRKKYEAAQSDKLEIVFCIFARSDKNGVDVTKTLAPKERPFGFKYILLEGADGHDGQDELGEEGGYYEMPAFVAQWEKTSGSKWGKGPANTALGDVLTLNSVVAMTLSAATKAIEPPLLTQQRNIIGDLDFQPGGETVVRDINGIKPLESGADFNVSNLLIDRLQDSIRRIFHNNDLELRDSPQMTATEVQVRYEMMQKVLGAVVGQIQNGLLDPIVSRTFGILTRAGRLPQMPEVVANSQGSVKIEYTGPLSRSQRSDKATSMERYMMTLNQYGQMVPELIDLVDPDEFGRQLAELMGVPATSLRSEDAVIKLRETRAEQQAQAAKREADESEARAAKDGSAAVASLKGDMPAGAGQGGAGG